MRQIFTFLFIGFYFTSFAQVTLNEIIYDPPTGFADGSNTAGEWVELFGTAGTDIGCYVLTDGDWSVTIPAGTLIPSDGIYVIGNATYANTPGPNGSTAVDLDVETCGCTTGANIMGLTNTGEFVGLYNPATTPSLVDGVIYESPSTGNLPENAVAITTAAITGCPSQTIDIAASASSYVSVGSGGNVGIARPLDGTGPWEYINASEATPNVGNSTLPLPIELLTFEASARNKGVMLKWVTASELDNEYFIIQHSVDGVDFDEIGIQEGEGTTAVQQTYTFTHRDVNKGIHYYRIIDVDFDGNKEKSEIISLQIIGENEIVVYPTVVENSFTIETGSSFGQQAFFEIIDISGRKIQKGILNKDDNSFQINTSDWHNGHYIIQVVQKGNWEIHRVIK